MDSTTLSLALSAVGLVLTGAQFVLAVFALRHGGRA